MLNRSNCDQKSQLSGILTKPLNPRDRANFYLKNQKSGSRKAVNISIK